MLFNSPQFVAAFLPLVLTAYFALGALRLHRAALASALFFSIAFYGWDNISRIPLLICSGGVNFAIGRLLLVSPSRSLLVGGLAFNIGLLGYFKYTGLLVETLAHLTDLQLTRPEIVMPVGISFYTITQIIFLVDAYAGRASRYGALEYGLFVTYFPHLVAGPILDHKKTIPQFQDPATSRPNAANLCLGATWFAAGLFKKVILADGIASFAAGPFQAANAGSTVGFGDAWIGLLSFALQIYFDFSGYSDMAIGLALMMGIHFPVNFNSPYKAFSLIDFWRRWHITLSQFLRDHVYIPLSGNRYGPWWQSASLMTTMLLGGLWHGASYNFLFWGSLHGAGLVINHVWRNQVATRQIRMPHEWTWLITILFVVLAWVPFRTDTLESSLLLWKCLFGLAGPAAATVADRTLALSWIVGLSLLALLAPNTQQVLPLRAETSLPRAVTWRPTGGWAVASGLAVGIALAATLAKPSAFLYFRF